VQKLVQNVFPLMQSWHAMVEKYEKLLRATNIPQGISLDLNRSYYDSFT
jgi:hypothetical protein